MSDFILYGAYGYTGQLIAEAAVERGLDPVLAGRDRDALTNLAIRLDCDSEVVALDEPKVLDLLLADATAVLHCAGPFVDTAAPMVAACLRTDTHYLDITGEIDVFEAIAQRDAEARDAGLMLLPGVGFDVVPTDCVAAHVADRLPDATHLELAFAAEGGISPGTAKTAIEHLTAGGRVRRDGAVESVPPAHETRQVDFGFDCGERNAVAIPWGDVATAYHTTGVPNVATFMAMPERAVRWQRAASHLSPLLDAEPVKRALSWLVERRVEGPTEQERREGSTCVWGRATDGEGEAVTRLRCPHTYETTVRTSLAVVERVLAGDVEAGYQTPAGAYGADLILDVAGTDRETVV